LQASKPASFQYNSCHVRECWHVKDSWPSSAVFIIR